MSPPPTKRTRITRACDQCFEKKDKCDGLTPTCQICTQRQRPCTYLRPSRKRGPAQGVRVKLEHRIQALESLVGFLVSRHPDSVEAWRSLSPRERAHGCEAWRAAFRSSALGDERQDAEQGRSPPAPLAQTPASPSEAALHGHTRGAGAPKIQIPDAAPTFRTLAPATVALPSASALGSRPHPAARARASSTAWNRSGSGGGSGVGGRGGVRNIGLVPLGKDPNEALGGFDLEVGEDQQWVAGVLGATATASPRVGEGVVYDDDDEEDEDEYDEEDGEDGGEVGRCWRRHGYGEGGRAAQEEVEYFDYEDQDGHQAW
ncbi:hypothetical protein ACQY0O_004841 [Thecaphora frezii]